jgi:hypothetical protein
VPRETIMHTPVIVNGTSILAQTPASREPRAIECFAEAYAGSALSSRELLKHTRLSAIVHDTVAACVEKNGRLFSLAKNIGVISASLYGCVAITDRTRSSYKEGGALNVDPVQFSKATHSFPISMVSMNYGWQGPTAAIVGRRNAWIDAIEFAASAIRHRLADALVVVAYEEIDNCVSAHLTRSGYFNGANDSDPKAQASEGCAAVVITSSELAKRASVEQLCYPQLWRTGNRRHAPVENDLVNLRTAHKSVDIALDASPLMKRRVARSRELDASDYRVSKQDYLGATSAALTVDWLQSSKVNGSPLAILSVDDKGARSSMFFQPMSVQ